MFREQLITSAQNPRVKDVLKLRDKKDRDQTQTFIIEGYRELLKGVGGGVCLKTLFYSPSLFLGQNENALIDDIRSLGVEVIEVSAKVFQRFSYRDRPDGLLAVAFQTHLELCDLNYKIKKGSASFFLVAESIEKPGNLGSILRSADAAGVDALFVCDRCTDIHNPNVVRASTGTLFTVPVIETSSREAIDWLKSHGIKIVAATPTGTQVYTEEDLKGSVAVAVGTEQLGLSKEWMMAADAELKIPMHGVADSLNVAAATTLLVYEVLRQRQNNC